MSGLKSHGYVIRRLAADEISQLRVNIYDVDQ
jgi:hypothetical protein